MIASPRHQCTFCCCGPSRATIDSASARSSGSSRSASSTSLRRSKCRGTARPWRICDTANRWIGCCERHGRRSSGLRACTRSKLDEVLLLADHLRRVNPDTFILVGGHSAAAFPAPFFSGNVDGICADDGELVVPALADALDRRRPPSEVPGLLLRGEEAGRFDQERRKPTAHLCSTMCRAPLRRDVDAWRRQCACLLFRPVWLIETARGCPFRCSFCSVWPLHDRGVQLRSIESVCDDFTWRPVPPSSSPTTCSGISLNAASELGERAP